MGFDIYGLDPDSEKGGHFRNNIWTWGPLWDFCYSIGVGILTHQDYISGQFNDGYEITKEKAVALAAELRGALAKKEKYEMWTQTRKMNTAIGEGCTLMPADLTMMIFFRDSSKMPTPFSWDNVAEFAEFLEHSGGFKIC